jgi:hypothetical protein
MEITGRILSINEISEKSAQIVLKKVMKGKVVPVAIGVFGYYKRKMDDMKLQKKEKIFGKIYLKSSLYKGKWYTDIYFEDIERVAEKPKEQTNQNVLFSDNDKSFIQDGNNIIDPETGEILL